MASADAPRSTSIQPIVEPVEKPPAVMVYWLVCPGRGSWRLSDAVVGVAPLTLAPVNNKDTTKIPNADKALRNFLLFI